MNRSRHTDSARTPRRSGPSSRLAEYSTPRRSNRIRRVPVRDDELILLSQHENNATQENEIEAMGQLLSFSVNYCMLILDYRFISSAGRNHVV
jgi:hypothetical protein